MRVESAPIQLPEREHPAGASVAIGEGMAFARDRFLQAGAL